MSAQERDATPATVNPSISVHERLASLERIVTSQQEEIAALHTELAARGTSRTRARDATHGDGGTGAMGGRRASRRNLLKLGGAAAAAGVAVAAGGLTRHAPIARAAAAADGDFVQMGSTHQNFSATGTFLEPATLSSPVQLLSVGNQSSLTSDLTHACGVEGSGPNNSNGVIGLCNGSSAYAIWGQTDSGYAVVGQSSTGVAVAAIGSGRFQQVAQAFAGAPTGGSWGAGEQIRDANGDLWICVVGGSPGHWRKVAAPQYGYAGGALNLLPVPIRLLDTRAGSPNGNFRPGVPIGYHATLNVPAAGVTYQGQTIPSGATAVFGLLTAALAPGVNCGDGSSAIAYAAGATLPAAVNVVFNPQDLHGAYTANFTLVATGASGDISIYNQPINSGVAVDYMFDCFGFVM